MPKHAREVMLDIVGFAFGQQAGFETWQTEGGNPAFSNLPLWRILRPHFGVGCPAFLSKLTVAR